MGPASSSVAGGLPIPVQTMVTAVTTIPSGSDIISSASMAGSMSDTPIPASTTATNGGTLSPATSNATSAGDMGVPAALLDIPTENPVNPLLMPSVGIAALPSGFGSMEGNGGSGNVTMLFRPTAVQRFEGSAVKLTTGAVAGLAGLVAFIFLL